MKHLRLMLAVAIVMLAMAMPSISAAQYHEERLDHFINERPDLKAQLDRNPNLIYDRAWREKHPALQSFLQEPSQRLEKDARQRRDGAPMVPITFGTSPTGGMTTIAPGCGPTIPNGPTIILTGKATATSTTITNGTIATGGTTIIPTGSMSIIRIGTSTRTNIRSRPRSTSTPSKSSSKSTITTTTITKSDSDDRAGHLLQGVRRDMSRT